MNGEEYTRDKILKEIMFYSIHTEPEQSAEQIVEELR